MKNSNIETIRNEYYEATDAIVCYRYKAKEQIKSMLEQHNNVYPIFGNEDDDYNVEYIDRFTDTIRTFSINGISKDKNGNIFLYGYDDLMCEVKVDINSLLMCDNLNLVLLEIILQLEK